MWEHHANILTTQHVRLRALRTAIQEAARADVRVSSSCNLKLRASERPRLAPKIPSDALQLPQTTGAQPFVHVRGQHTSNLDSSNPYRTYT